MRSSAASRWRGHGGDVRQGRGLQPRARRLDAPLRRRHPLLWRQRHRRRRPAARRGSGARRQDAGPATRHRLLLRRGRRGRGRVPRSHESRRALAACPCSSSARTTSMPWARRSARRSRRPTSCSRRRVYNIAGGGGRWHGCRRRRGRGAGARPHACAAAKARASWRCRTYRFRAHSMFDPELYRDKAEVEAWKKRDPIHRFGDWIAADGHAARRRTLAIEGETATEIDGGRRLCRGGHLGAGRAAYPLRLHADARRSSRSA